MSSGAALKSRYIRAIARPKFIRLLVGLLSLIGLFRLISKTFPSSDSDHLHPSDLVDSLGLSLPRWTRSGNGSLGSLEAMGRALHLSRSSAPAGKHGKRAQFVLDSSDHKRVGDWCTEEEYLDGEWVLREEEVTLDNIRRIYKYTVSMGKCGSRSMTDLAVSQERGTLKCLSKESAYGVDPEPDEPDHYARILETAQYEYRPRSGCKRHEWNRWNFAKYCLRTKAGCS